ncbi:hypothetical protein LP419_03535 [Massilia sp. H-1]|nr:hypothetical protein LP419_03535 [Massilia sp. H-1]
MTARFEQHQREVPYATLAQALRKQVRQLLGQDEAALAQWRASLRAALAPHAGLLLELIPELAFVIGDQLAPPPVAARSRRAAARGLPPVPGRVHRNAPCWCCAWTTCNGSIRPASSC